MGLDMYLERCNRKAWGYKDVAVDDVKENNPSLYEEIKPFLVMHGKHYKWESIFEEIGYWRKANAIHNWFVQNVQDGCDDCGVYEVTKEQLEELLDICTQVKDASQMEKGWVRNGSIYENGRWCPCYQEGEYVANSELAKELLPTQNGFFFGSTEYDQWYMEDIVSTVEILTKVLDETDFETQMVAYSSSW